MTLLGHIIAFGVRQTLGLATAAVKTASIDHGQALSNAIARANDRAWQVLTVALGGGSLLDRVRVSISADQRGVRDEVRRFLEAPVGLPPLSDDDRAACLRELRQLGRAGRLDSTDLTAEQFVAPAAHFERYSDPTALAAAARRAAAHAADGLDAVAAPRLAALLRLPTADGQPPLVAAAFAFFFRREVVRNKELFPDLALDGLRSLGEAQERGFAKLEEGLGDRLDQLGQRLFDELADLNDEVQDVGAGVNELHAKVDELPDAVRVAVRAEVRDGLRELREANAVRATADGPLPVSVTSSRERDKLRRVRDRMRERPELFEGDDWSVLGDVEAAAGEYGEACQSHRKTAEVAHEAGDAGREAAARFKEYRDACQQGDFTAALTALREAVALDRRRELFPFRQYEPVRILGAGGFGVVFECRHRFKLDHDRNAVRVAVKALYDDCLGRPIHEVFAEAHTVAGLRHDNVIGIEYWAFADLDAESRPFLVLEYFDGVTLDVLGKLPVADVLPIARQIAAALTAAHAAGVWHRDLKPGNVLVRREADGIWRVKVIDFGLSLIADAKRETQRQTSTPRGGSVRERSFDGTWQFASPEQKGEIKAKVDGRSDVYSFGKTVLAALFGHPESLPRLFAAKDVPAAVKELLTACVSHEPDDRPADFAVVLAVLDGVLNPAPQSPPVEDRNAAPTTRPAAVVPAEAHRRPPATDPVPPIRERKPGDILTLRVPLKPTGKVRPGHVVSLTWTPVAR
jgi:serine/threonine protein kinase